MAHDSEVEARGLSQEVLAKLCMRDRSFVHSCFRFGKSWHCVIEIKSAAGYESLGGAGDVGESRT